MLYVVATPIGNLSDITFRAIAILKQVDYILCEDTRQTAKILAHYKFKNKLVPFHKFNEKKTEATILDHLKNFREIALVSDAGMPSISDPGSNLIKACHQQQTPVTIIPGASSITSALCLTGLSDQRFQFVGFLPRKEGALQKALTEASNYPGVTVCFESPHRLRKSLTAMQKIFADTPIYIARELTKKFEELIVETPKSLLAKFADKPPKGELVLIIPGCKLPPDHAKANKLFSLLTQSLPLSRKDAAALTAEMFGIPKKKFYQQN